MSIEISLSPFLTTCRMSHSSRCGSTSPRMKPLITLRMALRPTSLGRRQKGGQLNCRNLTPRGGRRIKHKITTTYYIITPRGGGRIKRADPVQRTISSASTPAPAHQRMHSTSASTSAPAHQRQHSASASTAPAPVSHSQRQHTSASQSQPNPPPGPGFSGPPGPSGPVPPGSTPDPLDPPEPMGQIGQPYYRGLWGALGPARPFRTGKSFSLVDLS